MSSINKFLYYFIGCKILPFSKWTEIDERTESSKVNTFFHVNIPVFKQIQFFGCCNYWDDVLSNFCVGVANIFSSLWMRESWSLNCRFSRTVPAIKENKTLFQNFVLINNSWHQWHFPETVVKKSRKNLNSLNFSV